MIAIRPLDRSDADDFAALVRRVFLSLDLDPPPSAGRLTGEDVRAHLDCGGSGLVAEEAAIVAGLLWRESDGSLHVSRLVVDPLCQRQGLATRLLNRVQDEAARRRLPELRLSTRLSLTGNRRLFGRFGFVEGALHAHPGYARPTFVDMVKQIGAVSSATDGKALLPNDELRSSPDV